SGELVLAGATAVWTRVTNDDEGCCHVLWDARLKMSSSRTLIDRSLREVGCGGDQIGALAGRAGLAAYSKSVWTAISCPVPGSPDTGQDTMTGGHVWLL